MANKGNFIDAESLVKKLNEAFKEHIIVIEEAHKHLKKLNKEYSALPSDYIKGMAEMQKLYKEQEKSIKKLQDQIDKLNNSRVNGNRRSAEEIVNQRALAQNADRQARSTSALVGAYANLNARHQQASRTLQDLIARGRLSTQTQRQFNIELRNAQRDFNTLNARILSADRAVGRWNRTGERSIGFMKNLIGAFGVVGGVSLFAMISRDIFQTTKEIQSLDKALKLVTDTQDNFTIQQEFLSKISEKYGLELKGLTKQFTQFYVSAKDKISGIEIQGIFESVSKAAASMGLSVEQQERAFLALNQMMSKGTIQAEELRGQLGEALPGAFGIMAKAIGVTEKQLQDMMKAGDVLASEVLPKFAKQLEITYGIENVERIDSLASAQTRLTNAWTEFVASLDRDGNKLSNFLTKSLKLFSDLVEGTTLLLESDSAKQNRIAKEKYEEGYALEVEYLKSKKDLNDEYFKEMREYYRDQIDDNNSEILSLKDRNDVLTESFKGVFSNKEKLKKEFEDNKQRLEILENLNNKYSGSIKALTDTQLDTLKVDKKVNKESEKERKAREKAEEERLQQIYTNRKKELELQLFVINQSLQNEDLYYTDRLTALELYQRKQFEITSLDYAEQMRKAKGNYLLQKEVLLDYQKEVLEIIEKSTKERQKLEALALRPIDAVSVSGDPTKQLSESAEKAVKEFEALKEAEDKAKMSMEELKKITDEYLRSFTEGFFADAGLPTLFKVLNKEIVGFGQNFAVTFTTIAEIAQEAFNFISEASNQSFQNQLRNLEQERDVALQFAGESTSARAEIEEQFDARRRTIERRQAESEKRSAIFKAIINTAQAVVSALPNIPLSVAVGLIGAGQIALIQSQQIPQFWTGTDNAPEGMAWTQEKGREIITDKSGKIKSLGSDKGAQLTHLSKGDKVFTANETEALMFNNNLNNMLLGNGISMPKVEISMDTSILGSKIDNLAKTISDKPSFTIIEDEKGRRVFQRKQAELKELQNARLNIKGYNV